MNACKAGLAGGEVPYAYPEVLARHLDVNHLTLVFDAFWQALPFGTGGRRGRVGYGPNRMNPTTVAMTVQGHCQYRQGNVSEPDRFGCGGGQRRSGVS